MTDTYLKRTTIIVNNCDRAIAFYRDVVGMKEYYNQIMTVGGKKIPAGRPGAEVQLGIMEANRKHIAKLGILEWTNPRLSENPWSANRAISDNPKLGIGDVVFVCETPDIVPLIERLNGSRDCHLFCPPYEWSEPTLDTKGEIQMTTLSFFDPDGLFFQVNSKRNMPNIEAFGIQRTTLIVRDVNKSLSFYTEIMGMKVWCDKEMPVEGDVLPAGEPGAKVRLVILQGNDPEVGMLGLMQYLDPPLEDPGPYSKTVGLGTAMFVAGARDVNKIHDRMEAAGNTLGHTIHCPPEYDEVPGADGQTIVLTTMSFFDPDGFFYELNTRQEVS